MNVLEFLVLFVNMLGACSAQPMTEQRIGGQTYQIQAWTCQVDKGPVVVKAWRRPCLTQGYQYWGRTFYVKFEGLNEEAWYLNQFGEVQGGPGAWVGDAYQPSCGS